MGQARHFGDAPRRPARITRGTRQRGATAGGGDMRDRHRILIVDGDAALRRSLAEQFDRHGEFASAQCDSGAAALRLVGREPFDAVLLDSALPDMSGGELCRHLRRAGIAGPIVMLTAGGGTRGPEDGADDYLVKPFRLGELLERLRARLRGGGPGAAAVMTIGPYTLRPGAKLMTERSGGREVRLTDKEAAILEFLYRAGRVIGRDTLLGAVWGYQAGVTTHTLETHVYRLRRKIERDPAHAEILVTEPGGYRLLP
jgi:DNA-binding response OmpR family regulator